MITLTVPLLLWVAAYHLFDGLQALGVFVLRCLRITLSPLLVYGALLWGCGLLGGYRLAYHGLGPWPAMHTPAAFWIAATLALILAAGIFWLMIWLALRPAKLQS